MRDYPAEAPDPVKRPLVVQRWESLTFVHYRYDPATVQAVLPDGLQVDTFDGSAWVALVPFKMVRVRPPGLPAIPWLTTFPETNIRTYVKDERGGRGVYFSSLEITRLLGVAVARLFFGVPYTWASMCLRHTNDGVEYRSSRLWPSPRGARSEVDVQVGRPVEPDPLLDFLTNRWRAYTRFLGRIVYAPVSHQPWNLHDAQTTTLTDELVTAAGYPAPKGPPLVHYAEGVDARVGRIRRP
jgi:uncharacterized protein YqjF (DUF2071 family)